MLKRIPVFELIIIALLAAIGTASKVLIGIPIRIMTSSVGIPGGAIAGGIYMLWLSLAVGITKRKGAASLMALIQALMIFLGSLPGSHGILSLITYTLPGMGCDLVFLISRKKRYNVLHFILGVALANTIGTIGSNILFFKLPLIPLLFALISAALSGALGGCVAYLVMNRVEKSGVLNMLNEGDYEEQ